MEPILPPMPFRTSRESSAPLSVRLGNTRRTVFLLPNEVSETKVHFRFRTSAGKIGHDTTWLATEGNEHQFVFGSRACPGVNTRYKERGASTCVEAPWWWVFPTCNDDWPGGPSSARNPAMCAIAGYSFAGT